MLAGETAGYQYKVRDSERPINDELNLKHLCRRKIRIHLLGFDAPVNLFMKVSKLGLPFVLVKYLTYDVTLEHTR